MAQRRRHNSQPYFAKSRSAGDKGIFCAKSNQESKIAAGKLIVFFQNQWIPKDIINFDPRNDEVEEIPHESWSPRDHKAPSENKRAGRFVSSSRMQHPFAFGAIFFIALISISNALPKPGSITIPLTAVRVPGKYIPSGKACDDMFGAFPKEKYHQQANKFDLFIRHVNKAGNKTRDDKVTDDEIVGVIEFYRKKPLSADEKKQVADFIDKLAQVRSNYEYELIPTFGTKAQRIMSDACDSYKIFKATYNKPPNVQNNALFALHNELSSDEIEQFQKKLNEAYKKADEVKFPEAFTKFISAGFFKPYDFATLN
ncbi:hypothetical protein WR25_07385 [Diploscapter pachys]|uniref:Uncharacterized protein n=1 Tax=Diploscapter pachys TaxID=2018661 RepID=A0A2A2J7W5_9BILA|nr:hypothetical protein WR25_07385 [Diploscapter pachys]